MRKFLSLVFPLIGMSAMALVGCGNQESVSHNYSSDWSYDETYHWHACSDEGCSEVEDKAAHTFGSAVITTEATAKSEGVQTYTCSVCGYEKTEAIPALGNSIAFKADYSLDKVYDGVAAIAPTSENYTTDSDGAVSVSWYQGESLLSEAPINAGVYKVKISAPETTSSVAVSATLDFAISKKVLQFSAAVYYQTTAYSFDLSLVAKNGVIASDSGKVRASFTLAGYAVGVYNGTEGIKNLLLKPTTVGDTAYLNYSLTESNVSVQVAKWGINDVSLGFKTSYLDTLNHVYDGTAVSAPTASDLKSVYYTGLDVSFLQFTTKWYDMADPADPTLLEKAPTDAGDYKLVLTFEANSLQYAGTLEKEFTITPKKLTTTVFNFTYDDESFHYIDLLEKDGLVENDLGKSFNLGIYLNDTKDSEGLVIKANDAGTFTGDAIGGIYVTYDAGNGVTSESENYMLADNTVVNVLQNDVYDATISISQNVHAIKFPEDATSVGSVTLPSFVSVSYKSVTRTVGGVTKYYLSNDPSHFADSTLAKEDADYDFNVRVPATGNYSEKTFSKSKAFHFYPESSFNAIPSSSINMSAGSTRCFKITADASKSSHKFSIANGPYFALGSIKVFDSNGANVSISRGEISVAASGNYYIVFTASSALSGYTVSYVEA